MQRSLIILSICSLLAAGTASANTGSSREETVGVGIGATVGAVAGGPVGAIVGAAIGARFGDNFHHKNAQVAKLSDSLADTSAKNDELQRAIVSLEGSLSERDGDLQRLRAASRPGLLSLLKAGIEMDLLFRTDERALTDATGSRVRELATTLAGMPDVRIQLDGYADERGDATYNGQLSEERAAHVRDLLVAGGVKASRIAVTAHGESPAAEATADSYALERRVSMTLYIEEAPSFAANPD